MVNNDRMKVFHDLCLEYGFEDIYKRLTSVFIIVRRAHGPANELFGWSAFVGYASTLEEAQTICEQQAFNEHYEYDIGELYADQTILNCHRYITKRRIAYLTRVQENLMESIIHDQ